MFQPINIQNQFQRAGFSQEEREKLIISGFTEMDIKSLERGQKLTISGQQYDLESIDVLLKTKEGLDAVRIDTNESKALRLMAELELLEPGKAKELTNAIIGGSIDPEVKGKIEILQTALAEDGKYDGSIDGIPGALTQQAMNNLILENAPALINDSKQLEQDGRFEGQISSEPPKRNR